MYRTSPLSAVRVPRRPDQLLRGLTSPPAHGQEQHCQTLDLYPTSFADWQFHDVVSAAGHSAHSLLCATCCQLSATAHGCARIEVLPMPARAAYSWDIHADLATSTYCALNLHRAELDCIVKSANYRLGTRIHCTSQRSSHRFGAGFALGNGVVHCDDDAK